MRPKHIMVYIYISSGKYEEQSEKRKEEKSVHWNVTMFFFFFAFSSYLPLPLLVVSFKLFRLKALLEKIRHILKHIYARSKSACIRKSFS